MRALLGVVAVADAERERGDGLEEIGVARRVGGRADERAERGVGELAIGGHEGRDVERERREAARREARIGCVADGATEVHHRGEAIVRAAAERIVESAPLRAQHALERLPGEIADVAHGPELAVELRPELVERGEERTTCVLAVDLGLDLRARAPVLGLEDEQLDEAAPVGRRLERSGDDEAHAASARSSTR